MQFISVDVEVHVEASTSNELPILAEHPQSKKTLNKNGKNMYFTYYKYRFFVGNFEIKRSRFLI